MIYIGIPVHDERHTIGPLLWRIRELLAHRGRDFRLIVVDDASADGTSDLLRPWERILPLTRIRHEGVLGYAASLERIVREAVGRSDYPKRDALVTIQGDFTDPPEAIPEMVRRFEGGADLVMAAPPADEPAEEEEAPAEGRAPEPPPGRVRLARLGARFLARSLPRPEAVADPYGSLRLYRLFTLERALADLPSGDSALLTRDGWAASAELLLAVWPHVRQADSVEAAPDYGRRYRESRFRAVSEVLELRRAARGERFAELGRRVRAAEAQT